MYSVVMIVIGFQLSLVVSFFKDNYSLLNKHRYFSKFDSFKSRPGTMYHENFRAQLEFSKTVKIDPEIKTSINDMNLSGRTRKVLTEKGFTVMTPIQSQSYDIVHSGIDVVARSRTGTGKTFAFGLPLIEKIVESGTSNMRNLPLIIVLEPTRELAIQVADELASVCNAHSLHVLPVFGGSSILMQGT
jgi:superfamily II DNA/RNA helicase